MDVVVATLATDCGQVLLHWVDAWAEGDGAASSSDEYWKQGMGCGPFAVQQGHMPIHCLLDSSLERALQWLPWPLREGEQAVH